MLCIITTTELKALYLKRNLNLKADDVVVWRRAVVVAMSPDSIVQRGENYYIYGPDFVLTINEYSNTIIIVHKLRK